jgi:hypothetical protein
MSDVISGTVKTAVTLSVPVTVSATGDVTVASYSAIVDGRGPGTLVNAGTISSSGISAVSLALGGSIDNLAGGIISAEEALDIIGAGAVTNAGSIDGRFLGIYLGAGYVMNTALGHIRGGIILRAGSVVNMGEISSAYGPEVALYNGGAFYNLGASATISGANGTGVQITGGAGTVVNQGTIDTVSLLAGGIVSNSGYLGTPTDAYGLNGGGAPVSVLNSGVIVAASFASSANFTNTAAGVVSGYENGIVLSGGGYIQNAGTIFGLGGESGIIFGSLMSPPPGLAGVAITNGGSLFNDAPGAIIYGRKEGISIAGSLAVSITNDGTIIGYVGIDNAGGGNLSIYDNGVITGLGGTAINFGSGVGRLVLGAGAQINGAVMGSNPNDEVVFSGGGAQTLAGLSAQFQNISHFDNANADIAFNGTAALDLGATLLNSATIQSDGRLDDFGTVINAGTIIGPLLLSGVYYASSPSSNAIILSNAATGIIQSGTDIAIEELSGTAAVTIINAGTIAGAEVAISLDGTVDNLLVLDPGSVIFGLVEGGSTAGATTGSVLKLGAGAGTGSISGIGVDYTGFATVELAANAIWEVADSTGEILVGANADLIIEGAAGAGETIALTGAGATLSLADPGQFSGTIASFGARQTIDILDLQFNAADSVTLLAGDILEIITQGQDFAFQLDQAGDYANDAFHLASDGANGTDVTESAVPCFLKGTLIRTPGGDVAVEALAIGDALTGADGQTLRVKWIGRRRYGAAHAQDGDIQPIRIKKSAFDCNVPDRDLFLSPCHAVLVDGYHIPAGALANGVSIIAADGMREIEYFHIETELHTSIIANNTPVETFIDDDSRRLFDNAAEYERLYPGRGQGDIHFGMPRLECGPRLEALRQRFALRAGVAPAEMGGGVIGFLEAADRATITGWAFDRAAPHTPVLLDVLNRGAVIARVLANGARPDVKRAGFGQGRCGFSLKLPAPLPAFQRHEISVRPAGGSAALTGSPVVIDPGFLHDLVDAGGLARMVDAAIKSAAAPDEIAGLEADLELAAHKVRALRRAAGRSMPRASRPRRARHRVLMIDEHWPTPTRDAGSGAILSHAREFLAMGYDVAFCAAAGAPQSLLQAEGMRALQEIGVECHGQDGAATEDAIKSLARPRLDLAYLHRIGVAASYAGLIRRHAPSCRIIYAVADLHHVRFSRQADITGRRDLAGQAKHARATEFWAMRMADHVLTHSSREADYLMRAAPDIRVHVVPWAVEPRGEVKPRMDRADIAFIGGADHAPNADAVLHLAQNILPALWDRAPGMRCLVVGENWPRQVFGGLDPRLSGIGHQPDLAGALSGVRLTVAPLRFGAGIKGKVLESFSAGLPCVMTPMAAEGLDLDTALAGSVCGLDAFADGLLNVYHAAEAQAVLARSGQDLLRRQFSRQAVQTALSAMLATPVHAG